MIRSPGHDVKSIFFYLCIHFQYILLQFMQTHSYGHILMLNPVISPSFSIQTGPVQRLLHVRVMCWALTEQGKQIL